MSAPQRPAASNNSSARQRPTTRPRRSQSPTDSSTNLNNPADPTSVEASSSEPFSPEHSAPEHFQPPTADVYQRITDQIVAQVEAGAGQWQMPWHTAEVRGFPVNAVSRKPYRGGNILPLWIAAAMAGYESHEWATYKQWKDAGAQVRKGERSHQVVFWKFKDQDEVPDATQAEFNDRASRLVLVRGYSVFNAAQVDGYTPKAVPLLPEPERVESAEAFFRHTQAVIKTGGGRAFYAPAADEIVIPKIKRFPDAGRYYGVLLHELTHWTGHETRLDRDLMASSTLEDYAREELVAELGAAFLCAGLGLANEPRKDNAAYVDSWLRVLKSDPKAIFSAASKAQYAADYLHGLQPDSIGLQPDSMQPLPVEPEASDQPALEQATRDQAEPPRRLLADRLPAPQRAAPRGPAL